MTQGRTLPYNEESEVAVLGAIFQDSETVLDLCIENRLQLDAFHVPAHRKVFEAMGALMGNGRPVDLLSVQAELKRTNTLGTIGGSTFVDSLLERSATIAHSEYHIDELKKSWLSRRITRACTEILNQAQNCDNPEELRSECEIMFSNLHDNSGKVDVRGVFDGMMQDIQDGIDGKVVEVGLPTGFSKLDDLNEGGMRNGGVYWISGTEGTGKTSMKCSVIINQLKASINVASLTLEMTIREEINKLTSIYIDHNVSRLIRGKDKANTEYLPDARKLIVDSNRLFIADQSMVSTTTEFMSWAKRMVKKEKCKLVCVDYFQLLGVEDDSKMSIEEKTSRQSTIVKDVAGILNIPVICIAERNKEGKIRGSRRADYAGAGHWQLSRDEDEKGSSPDYWRNINLFMRKARYGVDFSDIAFRFKASTGLMEEGRVYEGSPAGKFDYGNDKDDPYGQDQFN